MLWQNKQWKLAELGAGGGEQLKGPPGGGADLLPIPHLQNDWVRPLPEVLLPPQIGSDPLPMELVLPRWGLPTPNGSDVLPPPAAGGDGVVRGLEPK